MKKLFLILMAILIVPTFAIAESNDSTVVIIGVEPAKVKTNVVFAPTTTHEYEATKPLVNPSTVIPNSIPQITFGTVGVKEVPCVDIRVKPLQKDDILLRVLISKKTKIEGLFKTLIESNHKVNAKGYQMANVRVVVFEKLSTKVWSTGGNITTSGAGYVGTGSMGGAGGLIPAYGRMTADSMFIVQYILVVGK